MNTWLNVLSIVSVTGSRILWASLLWCSIAHASDGSLEASPLSSDLDTPEYFIKRLFQANADRDLSTMEQLISKDVDMIGYTIAGRKYVGWKDVEQALKEEFESVTRLEFPITEYHVWTSENIAWYVAEATYIRYVGDGRNQTRTAIPLRETGILKRRNGRWILVHWHESIHNSQQTLLQSMPPFPHANDVRPDIIPLPSDLSGEWEIKEEDKSYRATLDSDGNGTYTWQEGFVRTTRNSDLVWQGTWVQRKNDREGGFEVILSNDRTQAQGIWWYTRVGEKHIPARQWGGTYALKRVSAVPASFASRTF
jgi:hypothetical protein